MTSPIPVETTYCLYKIKMHLMLARLVQLIVTYLLKVKPSAYIEENQNYPPLS